MRQLHFGDNIEVLRRDIPSESVALVYLDPPFNSNRNYNVLFRDSDRRDSEAQIRAFSDTWHWTPASEETFRYLVDDNHVPQNVSDLIRALGSFIGRNDVMAYLVMMTVRLLELHRVLKPSGSIYLHCDPTASHYLKVVMDTIWGPQHFKNEVIWQRTSAHSSAKRYGPVHDVLLFYSKSDVFTWNQQYKPYDQTYVDEFYTHVDPDGRRWRRSDLTGAGVRRGETGLPWRGIDVTAKGRHWFAPPAMLDELDAAGKFHWPKKAGGMPMLKRYLDEQPGVHLQDIWDDIPPLHNLAAERLGYPTQKPEALLERIIRASSNEGDIVLDPFCGCGTAVAVAERLHRSWIGIDISTLAISTISARMKQAFPDIEIPIDGIPTDLAAARMLSERNRYDFQYWALTLVDARPVGGLDHPRGKKGADRGVDGIIQFVGEDLRTRGRCIVQVKSGGNISSQTVRELDGTVSHERAEMGLLITLDEPTQPMRQAVAAAGVFRSTTLGETYPRLQIATIRELLDGRRPKLPLRYSPFQMAELRAREAQQSRLFENEAVMD